MKAGKIEQLTLIVPYYRNPHMLARQLLEWDRSPSNMRIVIVDDGSPAPAQPVVEALLTQHLQKMVRLYRIREDIPWNRGGARNLGAFVCETPWLIHVDIDHILPWYCAGTLLSSTADPAYWYRFARWRRGKADATRRKDKLPADVDYGPIQPHIDSYLCTKELYWRVGGYDEDYSGCLGGGSPFLRSLERVAAVKLFPSSVRLEVVTRSIVDDASDLHLDRSPEEYSRRRRDKERTGKTKASNPLRFHWERVL